MEETHPGKGKIPGACGLGGDLELCTWKVLELAERRHQIRTSVGKKQVVSNWGWWPGGVQGPIPDCRAHDMETGHGA